MDRVGTAERVADALARQAWAEVHQLLHRDDLSGLTAHQLDALADAAWWLCRVEESVAVRRQAYAAHLAGGSDRPAALAAWMVFYENHLAGHPAVAAAWLARSRRHLSVLPECSEHAYLAFSEALLAANDDDRQAALSGARRMAEIAQRHGDADLLAMGRACEGIALLTAGNAPAGLALLDEAMGAVLAGELSSLFTGWIYCLALPACIAIADLERAAAWNDAAMSWCASLPAGTPFHGLCRVHQVEVMHLRGAWPQAAEQARQACTELLAYGGGVAAEAFYLAGEIHRLHGAEADAEQAFMRAHELGRDPQPGLAQLRLSQGRAEAASAALRAALAGDGGGPVHRAGLLAAAVDAALAVGDLAAARAAADELSAIASTVGAALLRATAQDARGALLLAEQRPVEAVAALQRARAIWLELGLPYQLARTRMRLAAGCRSVGDSEGAGLELAAARTGFDRLGAVGDARRAAALLGSGRSAEGLTARELEVLHLLAAGRTNRSIAATLVLSEHTVARHVNNIFTKLGVNTRAAATAYAYTHQLTR